MERIIIIKWNKSTGPEPLIQYPPEKIFPKKDLFLKIWAKHELNQGSSIIEFISEDSINRFISIEQIFEGEIYFLILVYDQKEKIDKDYPDILAIISKNLIELINTNKITRAISEAFNTIKNYSKLDKEDIFITFLQDKIKFTILQIMQNGTISKSELTNKLRKDHGFSTANIDLLLMSFIRENLIIKKTLNGTKEVYFLIKDISCVRIPPKELHIPPNDKYIEEILKDYKKKLMQFYYNIDLINKIDNKSIINFFLDNDIRTLLKILRDRRLSVSECLNILNNKEELFNELLEQNVIYEAKGFVYLFSDIRFIKFTPYYLIEKLAKRYQDQEISLDEYITHLKLLIEQLGDHLSYMDYEIV